MKAAILLIVLAAAGCRTTATAPRRGGRPPATAAGLPHRMVTVDFEALVEHRVVTPYTAPEVGRDELLVPDRTARLVGRRLTVTNAMPGGWSEDLYVDGERRVWVVSHTNTLHVPEGVSISATRIFATTYELPADVTFGGEVELVDDPDSLNARAGA